MFMERKKEKYRNRRRTQVNEETKAVDQRMIALPFVTLRCRVN